MRTLLLLAGATMLSLLSGAAWAATPEVDPDSAAAARSILVDRGQIARHGLVGKAVVDRNGDTIGTVSRTVSMPVTVAAVTCQVLNLVLGPLHLDLLGLVIDLNQVHLLITAVQAPGNLLGNLLCAITHLLDGNPTAGGLAALLNAILALLGQL